jgi:hypothetical protein
MDYWVCLSFNDISNYEWTLKLFIEDDWGNFKDVGYLLRESVGFLDFLLRQGFRFWCFVDLRHSNAINTTNLMHTLLSLLFLFGFKASTCFGHHLPIFRRHHTNAVLVSAVCVVDVGCSLSGTVWEGTSQTVPCKDLLLWTNHRTSHHTRTHSFLKPTAYQCSKLTHEDGQGTPETCRVAKIKWKTY